jgi:S1-C subfamily serine protease
VKGRVVATSPTHDVALMKIDVHEWPVAPWSQHRPSVGTIVCSPLGRSGEPMRFAVVGSEQAVELAKPNDIPQIPVSIQPGAAGAPVVSSSDWTTAEFDGYRELLKVGDVITRINDIETSTAKEFGEAVDRLTYVCATNDSVDYQAAAPGSFAGDWVHLYIRRDSEHLTVPIPKIHSVSQGALTWHANPLSLRREAFPSVFAHDGNLRPEQCGGPVVDLQGNVVGLNVARADATRTLAIPSDVLQEILAELRRQAAEVQVDAKTPKVVSAGENIEIAGIGVALDVQDGRCLVRAVLPDSAAAKLGAPRVGDQILSVAEANAEPVTVKGMSLTEVVKLVRGEKGTTVRMTIISKGETENEARVVSLVRGSVKVLETVGDGKLLKPDTEIPDFEYIRLDKVGKGRIRDHIGKTVVLDFWASWCAPCIQSLDKWHAFLEVHPELRGKVEFIAIGVDEQMEDAVRTFEKRQWTSMTVVWAGPDVMKSYHLNSMPTVYFVGPGGRVRSTDQRLDLKSILTSEHKASQ